MKDDRPALSPDMATEMIESLWHLRIRLRTDHEATQALARALFEREEAILPEGETWDAIPDWHSYYEKCALAVVDALFSMAGKGQRLHG